MAAGTDDGSEIKRLGEHRNAFGFLRLFFASLVIVSHTPELVDGDRSREPLEMLTGLMSLGDLAVDGFFIISGYLIVGSYLKRPEIVDYLLRRVARIFPAFVVASLLCVLVVAPIAGASMADLRASAGLSLVRPLLLQEPWVANTFAENANTQLNGPMWTIAYEFRCYLLVIVLGVCGVLRSWRVVLGLAVALIGLSELVPAATFTRIDGLTPFTEELIGSAQETCRMTGMFLMGAVFFLKRGEIVLSPKMAGVAALLLVACFSVPFLAVPGIALFGAYLICTIAKFGGRGVLSRINNKDDISYGVYLYAWPVEQLLLLFYPEMPLVPLGLLTFALAIACGWLSWHWIEKPVMQQLASRSRAGLLPA